MFTAGQGGGGVAYGAHIGGFVGGLIAAWIVEQLSGSVSHAALRTPGRRPARPAQPGSARPRVVTWGSEEDAFREAVNRGDKTEAFRHLSELAVDEVTQQMPNEALTTAQWLAEDDQLIQAFELVRRVLKKHRPPAVDQAEVYYTLGLIRLRQSQPTSAYQHLMDALDFNPTPETEERIRKALTHINVYRRPR